MRGLRCVISAAIVVLAFDCKAVDLSYTFELLRQPTPALQVDVRFSVSDAGPLNLVLPNRYGGDGEMWRWVSDLTVDGPASLKAVDSPASRRLEVKQPGLLHVRYTVQAPADRLERVVYRRPILRSDYLHLLGNTFLVYPQWPTAELLHITVNWNLPSAWQIGNSFGFGRTRQSFDASLDDLIQAVYVGGDFRFQERRINMQPVVVATRGKWGFTDEELADTVTRIVRAQRSLFNDSSFPFYFISLLPADTPPGHISGVGRHSGFAAFMGAGAGMNDRLEYILSHELTHTWIPSKMSRSAETPPAMFWFSEGFTEYYAYVVKLLANVDDYPRFLDQMNQLIREYWESSVRNMPNEQAANEYFTNQKAGRLAYTRGLLIALNWNAAIRSTSDGKRSLNDLLRKFVDEGTIRDKPVDERTLGVAAAAYGVGNAPNDLTSWLDRGQNVDIRSDSFGPCAQLSVKDGTPVFVFGPTSKDDGPCSAWFQ